MQSTAELKRSLPKSTNKKSAGVAEHAFRKMVLRFGDLHRGVLCIKF